MSQVYGQIFSKGNLSETHLKIIGEVGFEKQVLELGASTGYLTKQMKANNCEVDVVEVDEDDAKEAQQFARKTYVGSLEDPEFIGKIDGKYDVILASNILEHLINPSVTLGLIKEKLKKDGQILIALPNIACWAIRKDLFLHGRFDYQETGILDKTHLRFFTFFTAQNLIKENGLRILKILPTEISYPLHFRLLQFGYLGKVLDNFIGSQLFKVFPNLVTSHILVIAEKND